ncbi:MAG: 50S ribosomal protein L6 [Catalinimonas sp.]
MSRIGKLPISLPKGVEVKVNERNVVEVKGPKGTLTQQINPELTVEQEDGTLVVKRPTEQKRHRALHGLYRSLLANMVQGVSEGYQAKLELIGVGYKVTVSDNVLDMSLGYSHNFVMALPQEVKATAETLKGKPPMLTLESIDKQLLGHMAAKIRSLRKIEPYKGKGIRFQGEEVRRKAGKTSAK